MFIVGTWICGISLLYLIYFNAPIYLVKGGRLGLFPGVLFHSCRPSFRHIGVMFLDFAFLMRLGVMGTPGHFTLNKTPPAWPNLGFTICHLTLFPLGSADSRVIFILTPSGQCSFECWSNLSAAGGHQGQLWAGLPEVWTIWCALRTRYVQLLSGFVGTSGGFAGLVLPLSKCLVNRDSETDRVFPGEGISFVDRESL